MNTDVKIFANEIEELAKQQIERFASLPAFANSKIRIMPDTHAGKGCVIGFTANLVDKVMPNVVGVDIGCGMHVVKLGNIKIDYKQLDDFIKNNIPAGNSVRQSPVKRTIHSWCIDKLAVKDKLLNKPRLEQSMGTLGGGNHFISIEEDESGCKYLIIHTGSRGLGKQVADIYQKMAVNYCSDPDYTQELISTLKKCGLHKHISSLVKEYKNRDIDDVADPDAAYIEGEDMENYINDMHICQYWARENRKQIAKDIIEHIGLNYISIMFNHEFFETVHNYINNDNIVRKGAVSAHKDEMLIIPLNMADGSLICLGKGNEDWNFSAPHGAGRRMSRNAAREQLDMGDFMKKMDGIYTTTACESTIDEAPGAYKDAQSIIDQIQDTVTIVKRLKPVYNFKAK